jgi:hypothetical protein
MTLRDMRLWRKAAPKSLQSAANSGNPRATLAQPPEFGAALAQPLRQSLFDLSDEARKHSENAPMKKPRLWRIGAPLL